MPKILYYRSQTQDFQKSCSRRLGDYLDRICDRVDEFRSKMIIGQTFRVFMSALSKWTILFTDTRPFARLICNSFAIILQQFDPLDLGMTLTSKVRVKVNRSNRDTSNKKKGFLGLSSIVISIASLYSMLELYVKLKMFKGPWLSFVRT